MSSLAVAPGPADWRGRIRQELEGEAWNDTSEKLGWFGPSLRPRSKTLDTAWRARTDTQDTCLQRRYISTRTSTRFIFLRTCMRAANKGHLGPSQGGRVCFPAKNRRWFGASHTACAAANCSPTHLDAHQHAHDPVARPERHGGCKLFPFTYPNKPRLVTREDSSPTPL